MSALLTKGQKTCQSKYESAGSYYAHLKPQCIKIFLHIILKKHSMIIQMYGVLLDWRKSFRIMNTVCS